MPRRVRLSEVVNVLLHSPAPAFGKPRPGSYYVDLTVVTGASLQFMPHLVSTLSSLLADWIPPSLSCNPDINRLHFLTPLPIEACKVVELRELVEGGWTTSSTKVCSLHSDQHLQGWDSDLIQSRIETEHNYITDPDLSMKDYQNFLAGWKCKSPSWLPCYLQCAEVYLKPKRIDPVTGLYLVRPAGYIDWGC